MERIENKVKITRLWGNNLVKNMSLHTTTVIMYILEVLRGVLYPEAHINGIQKKKKVKQGNLKVNGSVQ